MIELSKIIYIEYLPLVVSSASNLYLSYIEIIKILKVPNKYSSIYIVNDLI